MSKFKVGDTAKLVSDEASKRCVPEYTQAVRNRLLGVTGTIREVFSRDYCKDGSLVVKFYHEEESWIAVHEDDLQLVSSGGRTSYTLPRPITIKALLEKAPRCSGWNAEFVQALKQYPEGVSMDQAESFLSEAPQKWIDWLLANGFVEKAERKLSPGDKLKDESGQEYLLIQDDDGDFKLLYVPQYKIVTNWLPISGIDDKKHPSLREINSEWDDEVEGELTIAD